MEKIKACEQVAFSLKTPSLAEKKKELALFQS